jgi:hypothetical protein
LFGASGQRRTDDDQVTTLRQAQVVKSVKARPAS